MIYNIHYIELLTKNHKERIKVKDICIHPWIIKMESEYNKSQLYNNISNKDNNSNPQIENDKNKAIESDNSKTSADSNKRKSHSKEKKTNSIFSLNDIEDNAYDKAINDVRQKKRKVIKSNTNKTQQPQLKTFSNKEHKPEKGIKSLKVDESNDFFLFGKEISSNEDTKPKNKEMKNDDNLSPKLNNSVIDNMNNKKEKLYIEQETPTPNYEYKKKNTNKKDDNKLEHSINILNKASSIKKEIHPPILHPPPKEQSFWDKFFAPFRCLDNNNDNN